MEENLFGINLNKLQGSTAGTTQVTEVSDNDIAIIGMYVRFPMAEDRDGFWENILNGVSCVSSLPPNRRRDVERYLQYKGRKNGTSEEIAFLKGSYLENIDLFDYGFFNLSPMEAKLMNPMQRLFLEAAWSVFEDAGYSSQDVTGTSVGVYLGHISDTEGGQYREMIHEVDAELLPASLSGTLSSMIPSRISYVLNLKGPSMIVDTACSSSLVAVDLAVRALQRGDCELAMAGSVRINLLPLDRDHYKVGIESSDDETRTFDAHADGSGMGEGVAAILLKPLSQARRDGDTIYSVIKGSWANQDGASAGITAPNPLAQAEVMTKAWKDAGIDPGTITYIEAHGTATKLGDPIEIEGIQRALEKATDRKQFCAIGSVKSNMGHLYSCAGLAGLIKASLALKHRIIPPSLHFHLPNPKIPFVHSPLYVNTHPVEWTTDGGPRRCGVSSFGLSGTNCHVVLEESAGSDQKERFPRSLPTERWTGPSLLVLSAKNAATLHKLVVRYQDWMVKKPEVSLADLCYTAAVGRDHYACRLAILARDKDDLQGKLQLLARAGIEEQKHPWLWMGEGTGRSAPNEQGLSPASIGELVEQWSHGGHGDALESIAASYVLGTEVPWKRMYRGSGARRVSLPTYPFDRKRCWVEPPQHGKFQTTVESPLYYGLEWVREEAKAPSHPVTGDTVLIFGAWEELQLALVQQGRSWISVLTGDEYKRLSPDRFMIRNEEEDYVRLLGELRDLPIEVMVHVAAYRATPPTSLESLAEAQETGVFSLFYLSKALMKARLNRRVELLLIADCVSRVTGREASLKPEQATLFGLGKVIRMEAREIACRAFDVDEHTPIEAVLAEMSEAGTSYAAAFRDGFRYVQSMVETDPASLKERYIPLRKDGVYVITGGLGNLGLRMAQHLGAKGSVKLALVSRTRLPHRDEWSEVIAAGTDPVLCSKLTALQQMEAAGATVACVCADVSSLTDMRGAMEQLRRQYGRINGVIHAAGVVGKGFLVTKDKQFFHEVLKPKVMGTWVLNQVTEQDELDFFVMFSSGVALSGEVGQGDYTAANSYLDAFAAYRSRLGKPALSINWVVWEGLRMAEGNSIAIDGVFKPLPLGKALHAFDTIVNKEVTQLLVGEINPHLAGHAMEWFGGEALFHLPENIKQLWSGTPRTPVDAEAEVALSEAEQAVTLSGSSTGSYSDLEWKLGRLYEEVLGFEEFNIHDSFFEIGGDSVMLSRLYMLLSREFPGQLAIADLFAHTSIAKLAAYLSETIGKRQKQVERKERACVHASDGSTEDIAIIGMAARFPGAQNVDEYWHNLKHGLDCIKQIPEDRKAKLDEYLMAIGQWQDGNTPYMECGYLDGIEEFDYAFFRMSPREADLTDPCQRLFMQTVWHALEDAGYGGSRLRKSRTGTYVGFANIIRDSYQKMLSDMDPVVLSQAVVGNTAAMLPSRIAYLHDLRGPTMVVDTACSSALVSVHLASRAIRSGECEMAIAGGAKLFLAPLDVDHFKIGIEASDARTRAFDAHSDGSGMGEGVAAIVLKSLRKAQADGDHIYAVIKGSSINQDGSSMGITAPNPEAQTDVLLQAWADGGIDPASIAFFEAHGTGTRLGDPIELNGLSTAMRAYTDKKQFCALGSVKTNVGHMNEGAGLASLIKTVLVLKNRQIPPTLHFNRPNPKIDFCNSPVYINTALRQWEGDKPMRAAVSSFGFSGTNCHMVIEEYIPGSRNDAGMRDSSRQHVLTLSAVSKESLRRLVHRYGDYFQNLPNSERLEDICYTANTGRGHYSYRMALLLTGEEDARGKLDLLRHVEAFEDVHLSWFYYGCHQVTSSDAGSRKPYAITEQKKRKATQEAGETGQLPVICRLYVQGAEVDWSRFYGNDVRRLALPLYPFERHRCWMPITKRKNHPPALEAAPEPVTYQVSWVPAPMKPSPVAEALPASDGWTLLFMDDRGMARQMAETWRNRQSQVIEVVITGEPCSPTVPCGEAAGRWIMEGSEDDYMGLIRTFHSRPISRIVHLATITSKDEIQSLNELKDSQHKGLYSLFYLAKALAAHRIENDIELILVSDSVNRVTGKEGVTKPHHAPLFGFGRALAKEQPNLHCRCIDMDGRMTAEELAQVLESPADARMEAYRSGCRFVEMLEEAVVETSAEKELPIRDGGVYLFTGGLGAIGLAAAKHLANRGKATLVLISRRSFPARDAWDGLLEASSDARACSIITDIREIEAMGSVVVLYRADVTQAHEVADMLSFIRHRYGSIRGIIHGAGSVSVSAAAEQSAAAFEEVIGPKIYGTWLLDEGTAEDKPDFILMFSSIASVFESLYQSDYVAANAYLDAYSAYKACKGERALTINWATWKDKGMAANNSFQVETLFKTIQSSKALEVMDLAWTTNRWTVIAGELNVDSRMILLLEKYAIALATGIKRKLEAAKQQFAAERTGPQHHTTKLTLTGNGTEEAYTETEQRLAEACREVLGYNEIDIHMNFFEMGADSLLLKQIYALLDKQFPGVVAITDLFEYPSVGKLAQHISSLTQQTHTEQPAMNSHRRQAVAGANLEHDLNDLFDRMEQGNLSVDQIIRNLNSI
ncbi:SDR family NAD(P)-dependent oxidoreductase [Gorillibacterium sp. sgz500922]|uniref:SDR family NAD(P)-dependent oxidoreductase n=1 Tax=Gorillibacterium sp. sgz500922 TaxID=3446694 RepID=UPI003F673972